MRDFKSYFDEAVQRHERFSHAAHLHVTWAMLRDYPALEALARFRTGLREVAAASGHPEKYHETLTVAWFFLVLERLDRGGEWETFVARNPELFDAELVKRFYPADDLDGAEARQSFIAP